MESGRTVGKNRVSVGGMVTSYSISSINDIAVVPYMEAQAKYGISERFEVSGGFNSIGFLMFNGKYQLVGDRESAFALSFGLGGNVLFLIPSGNRRDIKKNINISIPVYSSFHVSEKMYFFLNPQFSRQIIFDRNGDNVDFFGFSTGIGFYTRIGEINFGGGYFVPAGELRSNISQIGISYRHYIDLR